MRAFAATFIALGLLMLAGCLASGLSVVIPVVMIVVGIAAYVYDAQSDDNTIDRFDKNDKKR